MASQVGELGIQSGEASIETGDGGVELRAKLRGESMHPGRRTCGGGSSGRGDGWSRGRRRSRRRSGSRRRGRRRSRRRRRSHCSSRGNGGREGDGLDDTNTFSTPLKASFGFGEAGFCFSEAALGISETFLRLRELIGGSRQTSVSGVSSGYRIIAEALRPQKSFVGGSEVGPQFVSKISEVGKLAVTLLEGIPQSGGGGGFGAITEGV